MDAEFLEGAVKTIRAQAMEWAKGDPAYAAAYVRACDAYTDRNDGEELGMLLQLKRYPVSIQDFIFRPDFLARREEEVWPEVLKELEKINNPGGYRVINPWTEAVFSGGIGSAKSTSALYTVAYQLYVLSCFRDPHATFGLDRASEFLFAFQSASGGLARDVDYDRFYQMVSISPYFTQTFPFNPRIKSELQFPHRIQVKAIGADMGTLGQNVIGGMIDELNFMAIVQESKKEIGKGVYDQAERVYNSISRRRKSRFVNQGKMPGILCLVSSKRYPGEFTDRKLDEAKDDPTIYVYDKRVWEVKPAGTFSGEVFHVFLGSLTKKARILTKDEVVPVVDQGLVMPVPVEYESEFKKDIIGAIRDIAGVSILARFPYFSDTEAVSASFTHRQSILNFEESDLESTQVVFFPARFTDLKRERWVHMDLGLTSDAAGLACGYVSRFTTVEDGTKAPVVEIDFILRVKHPPNMQIHFAKLRELVVKLRQHGLPIRWVSFDTYQSVDSIQILQRSGFATGALPLTKEVKPYDVLRTAMSERRVRSHPHDVCLKEVLQLEQDAKTGVIDHPPSGSKDCADALSGVVYGLSTGMKTWTDFGLQPRGFFAKMKAVDVKEMKPASHVPEVREGEDEVARMRSFATGAATAKAAEKDAGKVLVPRYNDRRDRTS